MPADGQGPPARPIAEAPRAYASEPAWERGTGEAELIPTAVRHELFGVPADQQERAQRRARLLAAMRKLDSAAYPSGYLDELRSPHAPRGVAIRWTRRGYKPHDGFVRFACPLIAK